jgi:hypothetical protein
MAATMTNKPSGNQNVKYAPSGALSDVACASINPGKEASR